MTMTASEVRIAWERRGEGPSLLLIHGLGYARWGWEPVAGPLSEDFSLLLFDNRGIGESDAPPAPYSVAELAGDALGVLDAAGVERAHVLGTSLGGMVAQELAAGWPERVDRLVLCCTTPGNGAHPMPAQSVRLFAEAPSLPPEVALKRFVDNAFAAPGPVADEVYRRRLANPPDMSGWLAQAAAGTGFAGVDLGAIRMPTLVLHGTEDNVVDVRNGELLAERIGDARLELFPETGHMFWWEQPDRFVAAVREFLS